VPLGTIGR